MRTQDGEQLLALMRAYQAPCVLAAGLDLGVFETLAKSPAMADEVAQRLKCDLRGMTILLDVLASLGLLVKSDDRYSIPAPLLPYIMDGAPRSVTAMLRHQAVCMRRWMRLPWTIQTGTAADPGTSIRGQEVDEAAFIEAMDVINRDLADDLVREINPGGFRCVLDVGGASGTWTLAWLKAEPGCRAILFDLPHVIPMARRRIADAGGIDRVELVPGDFYVDPLPPGADLAWVSAIIHQNSRDQNRDLFRRIAAAQPAGGRILIRDVVMEPSRTAPVPGAFFAVNMLAGTPQGNTYTLAEIAEDLAAAGYMDAQQVRRDEWMHSVVLARLGRRTAS